MLMLAALIALQAGTPAADSVPPRPITQMVHTVWTPKNGGAPSGIRALAQTADHYIWVGSFFGLFRFDGVRFSRYVTFAGDTVPVGPVNRMLPSRDGSLWLLGSGGTVYRINGGEAIKYGRPADSVRVIMLAESRAGQMMAAVSTGLFTLRDGKWEEIGSSLGYPGKACQAVWYDRDETLWAVTENKVVYLRAGEKKFRETTHLFPRQSLGIHFAQERDGTIWMSELGRSAHTVSPGGEGAATFTDIKGEALAVLVDRKGALWVATAGKGIRRVVDPARIRGQKLESESPAIEQFTMKNGLLADIPSALLEDHEGNIWVGNSTGLERFREGAFVPVLTAAPGRPRWVMAGRDSSVWTNPYNESVHERFGPSSHDSVNPGTNSTGIAQDSSGGMFILEGAHILRLDGKKFVRIPLRKGSAKNLFSQTIDASGKLWAWSADMGLLRLDGDTMIMVDRMEQAAEQTAILASDRKGRIWVSQRNRISVVTEGKVTRYGPDRGVAGMTYGFFEDSAGVMWSGTGSGLARFAGDSVRVLNSKQGIRGSISFGAVQDFEGAWWISTMPGILRFPPGDLERVMADSTYVPRVRLFDEADGTIGALVKSYYGTMITRSGDGRIWVATDSGLAYIDPRRLPATKAPPVTMEVIRMRGKEHAATDGSEIPPGTDDLEIDYTSLTYGIPERVQFRYRLEGADTAWRDVGARRRAYYTNLSPGPYRFLVSASYGDGVWNEEPASWSFRVLPAWYQTTWFRLLAVLTIAGLGGATVALIQRGRHNQAARVMRDRYETTLAERARIAQDLHDTLLQGFAGVTLQLKAAELALPDSPGLAAETIQRTQQLARASLREARERVWEMKDVDSASEDLPAALERLARERTAGSGIEVKVSVSGDRRRLPRPIEDAAFRIGREAVVNTVRHAEASQLHLGFEFTPSVLRLTVEDDGRGFTAAAGEEARQQGHFGLSGMRDRAEHMGGKCTVGAGRDGGTIVALELSIP